MTTDASARAEGELAMAWSKEFKAAVIDFLETAHGYALLGSIFPMRKAGVECDVRFGSDAWNAAEALVRAELVVGRKPTVDEYVVALGRAIAKADAARIGPP